MFDKGSVAVDGTSLTIFDMNESSITISLIPHTVSESVIGEKNTGDIVNIRCDMIGKYIERFISKPVKQNRFNDRKLFTRKRISIRGSIMFHRIEEALEDLKQGKSRDRM